MAGGFRPRTERVAACRPRPVTEAPLLIPDAMAAHLDDLLTDTGVIEVIETELAHRPGPPGLPVRTVLLGCCSPSTTPAALSSRTPGG